MHRNNEISKALRHIASCRITPGEVGAEGLLNSYREGGSISSQERAKPISNSLLNTVMQRAVMIVMAVQQMKSSRINSLSTGAHARLKNRV